MNLLLPQNEGQLGMVLQAVFRRPILWVSSRISRAILWLQSPAASYNTSKAKKQSPGAARKMGQH